MKALLLSLSLLGAVGCAGCATTAPLHAAQRARDDGPHDVTGVPTIATKDGTIDADTVYACVVYKGQFVCIPYGEFEEMRARHQQQLDQQEHKTTEL